MASLFLASVWFYSWNVDESHARWICPSPRMESSITEYNYVGYCSHLMEFAFLSFAPNLPFVKTDENPPFFFVSLYVNIQHVYYSNLFPFFGFYGEWDEETRATLDESILPSIELIREKKKKHRKFLLISNKIFLNLKSTFYTFLIFSFIRISIYNLILFLRQSFIETIKKKKS